MWNQWLLPQCIFCWNTTKKNKTWKVLFGSQSLSMQTSIPVSQTAWICPCSLSPLHPSPPTSSPAMSPISHAYTPIVHILHWFHTASLIKLLLIIPSHILSQYALLKSLHTISCNCLIHSTLCPKEIDQAKANFLLHFNLYYNNSHNSPLYLPCPLTTTILP